jgi:hypothetical protein
MKIVRVHYGWVDGLYANDHEPPDAPIESIHLHSGMGRKDARRKQQASSMICRAESTDMRAEVLDAFPSALPGENATA